MYRLIKVLAFILATLPVCMTVAAQDRGKRYDDSRSRVYLSGFAERQSFGGVAGTDFDTAVASAALGIWVRNGIGLEAEIGTGVIDDSVGTLDLDVNSQLALNLRLESPPVERVAAYFLFSFIRSDFDLQVPDGSTSSSLSGFRAAAGFTLMINRRLDVDVAFTNQDFDDDLRTNSFRFGLRFGLGGK